MQTVTLLVAQLPLAEGLPLPSYAHEGEDAGLDLPVAEAVTIPAHSGAPVKIGIHLGIPEGYYVRITGKGSSAKAGLGFDLENVDQGYTGELTLLAWNKSNHSITIPRGKCVAQAVLTKLEVAKVVSASVEEVKSIPTSRGGGRMNSSGRGIET